MVHTALLLGLFLAALNLRPAVASISPLLGVIRSQVDLSHTVAGLLTTIPTLCIGVGAFLVPSLAARLGAERALTGAMLVIGWATFARLWAGDVTALFATTLVVGAGIALGQTLLPGLVRMQFAERPLLITALYSLGITLGAAIPAAAAAPLRDVTGSWQVALAAWTIFAIAAAVVLAPIPVYEDHGWSATRAGLLLTLLSVAQAVATLVLTRRGRRLCDRRPMLIGSLAVLAVGMTGVAVAPYAAPVIWALLLGLGNGIVFPAMLVLPVDYAEDAAMAARLAGMGFGVGYLLASLGPVLTGGLRDLTGSYALPFGLYAGICLLLMVLASRFRPRSRTVMQ
jgi:CP family cyanate transporter-like MFS transporter